MSRLGGTRTPTRGMPPALLGDPEATPTPIPAYTNTPALEDLGFPGGSGLKNTPANPGNSGLIPGSGKTPCRRKWQPTPVFLTGESQGERSWQATVRRVANSQAQLSDETTTKGARAGGRATKRLRPWPAKAWPLPSFPSLRLCGASRTGWGLLSSGIGHSSNGAGNAALTPGCSLSPAQPEPPHLPEGLPEPPLRSHSDLHRNRAGERSLGEAGGSGESWQAPSALVCPCV